MLAVETEESALPTPRRPSAIDYFGGATTAEEQETFRDWVYALYRRGETAAPAESGVQLVAGLVAEGEEAVG